MITVITIMITVLMLIITRNLFLQVSPKEIEDVLRVAEGVGEVAVIGVPSLRLGEAPLAFVVPLRGVAAPSPQALKDYVAGR